MFRDYLALGVLLAGALPLLATAAARADESRARWLSVTRSADAVGCPDARELKLATEALLEAPISSERPLIHVAFERHGPGFVATLRRADSDHAGRKLRDRHGECAPLAQAVVTTLALMLETRADEPALPTPEPEPVPPAPEPVPPPPRPTPASAPSPYEFALGLEGGAGYGVLGGWSPLLGGQLAFGGGALRVRLGALYLPPQRTELGPGSVEVGLIAISTRACLRWLDLSTLDLYGCSGVFGGVLRGRARGYTRDFERSRPWLALPLEVFAAAPLGSERSALSARLGATALVPARRETFSVEGLGPAVEPERVAVLLWLGLDGSLFW